MTKFLEMEFKKKRKNWMEENEGASKHWRKTQLKSIQKKSEFQIQP